MPSIGKTRKDFGRLDRVYQSRIRTMFVAAEMGIVNKAA